MSCGGGRSGPKADLWPGMGSRALSGQAPNPLIGTMRNAVARGLTVELARDAAGRLGVRISQKPADVFSLDFAIGSDELLEQEQEAA